MQFQRGDQPVSGTIVSLSAACRLGCQFLPGCREPNLHDLAELNMLLGMPEIVVILHIKPTLWRTERERSPLKRLITPLFAGRLFQQLATVPRWCPLTSRPHNPIRQNTRH